MDQSYNITFDRPIAMKYAEELEKRLFFIAADITGFQLIKEADLITGVAVQLLPGTNFDELVGKVKSVIKNEITVQKILPPKIIWQSSNKCDHFQTDIFEQLLERDLVHEMGEGMVSFGEPLINLMDTLDARIKEMTVSLFGAKEYRYPTLIQTKALEKCGYFNSFPHMLMFVTRLHNDIDLYRKFAAEYEANREIGPYIFPYCKNVDYCLPPTMCYHTYQHLQNRQFQETEQRVITSKGKSFRYESKYHRTLERLWDFTIREIVFMGTKDFVIDCRRKYMEATFALIESLGLVGHSEVAGDPFFCNADTVAKILNQKMQELKYELRLNIETERTIAAASFNFHDQFFGQSFNIKRGEDWMRTGCVGFGLERLAFAFISRHGLDEKNWLDILNKSSLVTI